MHMPVPHVGCHSQSVLCHSQSVLCHRRDERIMELSSSVEEADERLAAMTRERDMLEQR